MLACILLKVHLDRSYFVIFSVAKLKFLSTRRETMGSKILVADDSPTVRHLIQKFLDGEGYEIVTTSDSADVVDLIDEINPDLVISDIMMPGMDGYTFLRHIRKEKTWESLPVIIMSTKKREIMEDLFVSYGISGYLEKPFDKEQLVELIQKALE
jgi:CheY-like chemotaxis protein